MGTTPSRFAALERRLGYHFREAALLEEAVSHPSIGTTGKGVTNQRLEFLGDAVLQLVISQELYLSKATAREGTLSKYRSMLTKGSFLARLSQDLGLPEYLVMSPAEELSGGRDRTAAMEDAFEALIGAIYLDGGLETVRKVVLHIYGPLADRLAAVEHAENPKGRLQEIVQPEHGNAALRYEVAEIAGEAHRRRFSVNLFFRERLVGTGAGTSKKEAEENAARVALSQWKTSAPA